MGFLYNNWGTILIGLLVACIVSAIVVKMVRDKRKGKCAGCGCGCGGCPSQSDNGGAGSP